MRGGRGTEVQGGGGDQFCRPHCCCALYLRIQTFPSTDLVSMGCTGARVTDMKLTLKNTIAAILLMWSFAAPVAAGPLEDGYTAYTRGDFATAMRLMRPLADQGNITA